MIKRKYAGSVFLFFTLILLWFFLAPELRADEKGVIAVVHENDIFSQRDQYYTSGIRLNWFSPPQAPPGWLSGFANKLSIYEPGADHRICYSIGQNMYTPLDITEPDPSPDDRPYAGWLYGSIGFIQDRGSRLDTLRLVLGVVGPASRAEQTQKKIHQLTGADDPEGWEHQLHDELGASIIYGHQNVAWLRRDTSDRLFEISPGYSLTLGNVKSEATVSAMIRWGEIQGRDYGPPLINSTTPGAGFFIPGGDFEWYLYLNLKGHYVAHNIFLDGNTIRDSRSVDREPLVGDAQLGFVVTWTDYRLSYTHVFPTKEFKTQEKSDDYGAITFGARF
ncbi:MAG: lipid A deacylase LpxR family protein [bacterium]